MRDIRHVITLMMMKFTSMERSEAQHEGNDFINEPLVVFANYLHIIMR